MVFHRLLGATRALFRRDLIERELTDELRTYLEIAVEDKMAAGMSRPYEPSLLLNAQHASKSEAWKP